MRLTSTLILTERPPSWLADLRASRLNLELVAKKTRVAAKATGKRKAKTAASLFDLMMLNLTPDQKLAFEKGKSHGAMSQEGTGSNL
jgi:hypothetical protein